eukprot:TRINITY_DN55473_c0_g1_i1.p1 TRINITY_DN55473_c0_g1~~TRINITY_DN55473_c0_g1_i1.p1  ORF type:complete len:461 (+),score=159.38 TRINITY_DN55473_c0_g1_i1:79-1383(+)
MPLAEAGQVGRCEPSPSCGSGADYRRRVADATSAAVAAAGGGDNVMRRRAFCDAELLLLEIEADRGLPEEERSEFARSIREATALLRLEAPRRSTAVMLLRFLGAFIYFCIIGTPFLALMLPLRWAGLLLRRLGWGSNRLPADTVQWLFVRGMLACFGVVVLVEGLEHVDPSRAALVMFQHASNLDAFVLTAHSPLSCKWIGKKQIFWVPIFGWVIKMYGHIPIDRSNLESAKKSLESAKVHILRWCRSVGIAPEGTRSKTGMLQPFKKGPFHVAQSLALPVQPVVFFGAYELWPPGQLSSSPGIVSMRFLPVVYHHDGQTIEERSRAVRRAMLIGLRNSPVHCRDYRSSAFYRRGSAFLSDIFLFLVLAAPVLYWVGATYGVVLWGLPWLLVARPPVPGWLVAVLAATALSTVKNFISTRGQLPLVPESDKSD